MAAQQTGGVKPMSIAGRMVRERERLIGMSNEERTWRRQWLKDLQLQYGPRQVKVLELELSNTIKRFYRAPLEKLFDLVRPIMGYQRAYQMRFWTGKIAMAITGIYVGVYYFKYNQNDWTRKSSWRVISSRKICNLGDPEFPKLSERYQAEDYAARGFKQSPI